MADYIAEIDYLAGATRFKRISEKLHIDGDKIYADHGIDFKASWFPVFYALSIADNPKTVSGLADEIGFSNITVKNVLRELEANALVKIIENPGDGRSKHVSLTLKGQALLIELKPIWQTLVNVIKETLILGHPDFLNIIARIDMEINKNPINERAKSGTIPPTLHILDYTPALKKHFYKLAGNWLLKILNGTLEDEDNYTLHNPDKAYLEKGGFMFFAVYNNEVIGCVALKRLNEDTFEFAKLFVDPDVRQLGIATKLIERCISRCKENMAKQLWMQTTMAMPHAHTLYPKMGFRAHPAPPQMSVLSRSEKVMVLDL